MVCICSISTPLNQIGSSYLRGTSVFMPAALAPPALPRQQRILLRHPCLSAQRRPYVLLLLIRLLARQHQALLPVSFQAHQHQLHGAQEGAHFPVVMHCSAAKEPHQLHRLRLL